MKYNIKASVASAKKKQNDLNKIRRYFKLPKKVTRLRLVPIGESTLDGGVYPFREVQRYKYDAFKRSNVVCPTMYGGTDPIRAYIFSQMDSGAIDQATGRALLDRFKVETRYVVAAVVRENDEDTGKTVTGPDDIKFVDMARNTFNDILKFFIQDEKYGSVIQPGDDGFDIEIDKGQDAAGKWFVKPDVVRRPTPLAGDDAIQKILQTDFEALIKEEFVPMSEDELMKMFQEQLQNLMAGSDSAPEREKSYGGTNSNDSDDSDDDSDDFVENAGKPFSGGTKVSDDDLDALLAEV